MASQIITPDIENKINKAVTSGMSAREACEKYGVKVNTWYMRKANLKRRQAKRVDRTPMNGGGSFRDMIRQIVREELARLIR